MGMTESIDDALLDNINDIVDPMSGFRISVDIQSKMNTSSEDGNYDAYSSYAAEEEDNRPKYSRGLTEKILMIPIGFKDTYFQPENDKGRFEQLALEMKDYYENNSNYLEGVRGMTVDFHIADPVFSEKTMAYYGADSAGIDDLNGDIGELTREAVLILDQQGFDFSEYDVDQNGLIDHLFIVHAGSGQEADINTDLIWSHYGGIYGGELVDGVYAYGYTMMPEDGELGVFAHEFGHDLGLPDLYDTDGMTDGYSGGIGRWGLMGSGSWNHMPNESAGSSPSNISAWCKFILGWTDPYFVTGDIESVGLYNFDGFSEAVIMFPQEDNPNDEYFIAEYRRQLGYDAALPGEGLLIWHVDHQKVLDTFGQNRINGDQDRMGIELEQADGQRDLWYLNNQGDETDPFGMDDAYHHFMNIPYGLNLANYYKRDLGTQMMNIHPDGDFCGFDIYMEETVELSAPSNLLPSDGSSFEEIPVFSWDMVPKATGYHFEIYSDPDCTVRVGHTEYSADKSAYSISGDRIFALVDFSTLEANQTYYWKVHGIGGTGTNDVFSEVHSFYYGYESNLTEVEGYDFVRDGVTNVFYGSYRNEVVRYDFDTKTESRLSLSSHNIQMKLIHGDQLFVSHGEYNIETMIFECYLSIIDLNTFTAVSTVETEELIIDMCFDKNGILYYTVAMDLDVTSVYPDTMEVIDKQAFDGILSIEYDEKNHRIFAVTNGIEDEDIYRILLDDNGVMEVDLSVTYNPDHTYDLSSENMLSPDGNYLFNKNGTIYHTDSSSVSQVHLHSDAFDDICFDLDQGVYYLLKDFYIHTYDYVSNTKIKSTFIYEDYLRMFLLDHGFIGHISKKVDGVIYQYFNEIRMDADIPYISFSFDGEHANKLMGTKAGMSFAFGSVNGVKRVLTEDDYKLNSAELKTLMDAGSIYVFVENKNFHDDGHHVVINLLPSINNNGTDVYDELVWNESNNEFLNGDFILDYRYSSNDLWTKFVAGESPSFMDGLVSVRVPAYDLVMPLNSTTLKFSSPTDLGNILAWQWVTVDSHYDESTGLWYLLDEDHMSIYDSTNNTLSRYDVANEAQDIIVYEGNAFTVRYLNDRVEIYENSLENTSTLVAEMSGDFDELEQTGSKVWFSGATSSPVVYEMDMGRIEQVDFSDGFPLNEKLIPSLDSQRLFFTDGSVYELDPEHGVYHDAVFQLEPFVDLDYSTDTQEIISCSEDTISVYNYGSGELVAEKTFELELLEVYINGSDIHVILSDRGYRLGELERRVIPDVSLDLGGVMAGYLMGSDASMEYSLDGGVSYRQIMMDDMSLEIGDIRIEDDLILRYLDADYFIESQELVFDILEGQDLPDLIMNDEAHFDRA